MKWWSRVAGTTRCVPLRRCPGHWLTRLWLTRHRTALSLVMVLVLIGLGFAAMQQLTRELHFSHIRAALHALTPWQIAA